MPDPEDPKQDAPSSFDSKETTISRDSPPDIQRVGSYRILQTLGEGGMGTLYLAEQQEPIRRKVALKLIKLGMDTKEVVSRFESERQVLALMDHPSIAKVFDAGATEQGRPYFVMEYVKGPSSQTTVIAISSRWPIAWLSSRTSAWRFSTPTRRASSTGTSSRRTFSCPCRKANRSPR